MDTHAYAYVTTYTSAAYTSAHNCHACANANANRCADHINPNTLSCYSGSDMGSNHFAAHIPPYPTAYLGPDSPANHANPNDFPYNLTDQAPYHSDPSSHSLADHACAHQFPHNPDPNLHSFNEFADHLPDHAGPDHRTTDIHSDI